MLRNDLLNSVTLLWIATVIIVQMFSAPTNMNPACAQEPLIVAHRGASYDAPENTLPAFELAWQKNADAIEGDFYLTKDRRIVCIHDKSTKKYCDQDLVVANSTFEQLRKLDVGAYKHKKYRGTKIPTIDEVFATVPAGKKIYIEVKCGTSIIPHLVKAIDASQLKPEQLIVICFDHQVIKQFKQVKPQLKAYWLAGVNIKQGQLTPSVEDACKILKETKADGFSTSTKHLPADYVVEVQQQGFDYHVWTINDPQEAVKLRDWKVKSITTDRPALIRKAVESN